VSSLLPLEPHQQHALDSLRKYLQRSSETNVDTAFYDGNRERYGRGVPFQPIKGITEFEGMPQVMHWVRNLKRPPDCSFWFQTSTDKFYPDFVALLEEGRVLVVEYKGANLLTTDDTKEKRAIGELWEARSKGRGIFRLVSAGNFSTELAKAVQ